MTKISQNLYILTMCSGSENFLKIFEKFFKDYFVLYKPQDKIGGDFYWLTSKGDTLFFALADCTGHGVPGAFMSMIGNSHLNEIVIEKKITDPAKILSLLNEPILGFKSSDKVAAISNSSPNPWKVLSSNVEGLFFISLAKIPPASS